MNETKQTLNDFFDAYESRTNKAIGERPVVDVEATAGAFADYFVESSPNGVTGGKNDDEFRKIIPQGFEFYRSIGTKSMTITARELTRIDDMHWMAKVSWRARYLKHDETQEVIDFDVLYFVTLATGEPKIFAYVTGDEQRVLKEHGIIPNPQPDQAQPA